MGEDVRVEGEGGEGGEWRVDEEEVEAGGEVR